MNATEAINAATIAVFASQKTGDHAAMRAAEDDLAAVLQGEAVRAENGQALDDALLALHEDPHDPEKRLAFIKAHKAARDAEPPPSGPLQGEVLGDADPPRREWLVNGWIPAGRLASLYGAGGAGKSRLALQIAAAVMHGGEPVMMPNRHDDLLDQASGLGTMRDGGQKVLWLTWEDETEEIRRRWRMAHEAKAIKVKYPDRDRLTLIDMRKIGGPLWAPAPGGHVSNRATWTPAGRRFLQTMRGHALAIIDPLAAAYASSEIDRALVRAFASALDGEAERSGCAVLLIGHPPKEAEKGGSGYSGSTDWRNAVRSMMVLEKSDETGHCLDGSDSDKARAWRLRLDKASYAPEGRHVWLKRHHKGGEGWTQLAWQIVTAHEAARARNPDRKVTRKGDGGTRTRRRRGQPAAAETATAGGDAAIWEEVK